MGAAWAQAQTGLTIDYSYRGTYSDQGARVGTDCYVTPQLMRKIGWSVDVTDGVANVLAEGRAFQLQSKIVGSTRLYPFDEALRYVGAASSWSDNGHLTVLSQVRMVEVTAEAFRLDCTLAIHPRVFKMQGPDRLVIDVSGAELEKSAVSALPPGWKVTQFAPTIVRCVFESPSVAVMKVPTLADGRTVELPLAGASTAPAGQVLVHVGKPVKTVEDAETFTIRIPVTGQSSQGPSAVFVDPDTVQIALPGSTTDSPADVPIQDSKHTTGFALVDDKQGTASVTVNLTHPMAFHLSTDSYGVLVTFLRPKAQGGLLGKVIVVDAGHGGKDNGATHHGVEEKNQTLPMAKTIAKSLTDAGASVILTRSDDTFIPLNERPGMANRSHADLFISCHFNSNSVEESRSGIIVFYHKDDSMDMLLAECLRHEVAKTSGLPDLGTWSDGRIYSSGFAVLRGAQMPAVLMELGFLNNSKDRERIQKQEFRDAVAQAVVKGVKVFFGDEKKG